MFFRRFFLWLALALAANATTVQPPTFPELVGEADGIYRGQVTSVVARRVPTSDNGGSVIKTFVTFDVERAIKGAERTKIVLEFLGGTLGDESLEVGGMPHFNVGDREILFVQRNGVQFCPLVRLGHGRYRVAHDASTQADYVLRDNHAPLTAADQVSLPLGHAPESMPGRAASTRAATTALSPDAFEAQIRGELQRAQIQGPRP